MKCPYCDKPLPDVDRDIHSIIKEITRIVGFNEYLEDGYAHHFGGSTLHRQFWLDLEQAIIKKLDS